MLMKVVVALVAFACVTSASSVLNLKHEAHMLDKMCQSTNSSMSPAACVVRGQMLLSTLSQGHKIPESHLPEFSAAPRSATTNLGNCADTSDYCGCQPPQWVECGAAVLGCAVACIGTWGAACISCLDIIPGCDACACFWACNLDYGGPVPQAVCYGDYANCAN